MHKSKVAQLWVNLWFGKFGEITLPWSFSVKRWWSSMSAGGFLLREELVEINLGDPLIVTGTVWLWEWDSFDKLDIVFVYGKQRENGRFFGGYRFFFYIRNACLFYGNNEGLNLWILLSYILVSWINLVVLLLWVCILVILCTLCVAFVMMEINLEKK